MGEFNEFIGKVETKADIESRKKAREEKKKENRRKYDEARGIVGVKLVENQPLATVKGQKQAMQELKAKLLTEGNSNNILRKILEIAYNDEHPGQMNALKMCFDRMLPTSMFEEKVKGGDRPQISINITGINDVQVEGSTIDGESNVSED